MTRFLPHVLTLALYCRYRHTLSLVEDPAPLQGGPMTDSHDGWLPLSFCLVLSFDLYTGRIPLYITVPYRGNGSEFGGPGSRTDSIRMRISSGSTEGSLQT